MRWPAWVLGGVALAAVIAFVLREAEQPAPGPLHPSHASVPELANCEACHVADGTFESACAVCHGEERTGTGRSVGLHALRDTHDCAACHLEHRGATVDLAGATAFLAAGISPREELDHERDAGLVLDLDGRHRSLACVDCHAFADAPSLRPGQVRFRGQSRTCTACHEDAHAGGLGSNCAACHGQTAPFAEHPEFDHAVFPLTQAHADRACSECHGEGGPRVMVSASNVAQEPRRCVACHANVHADTGGSATRPSTLHLTSADDCARCHEPVSFDAARFGPEEHAARGVPLLGAHAQAECAGCHRPERALPSELDRCGDCHADPHASSAAAGMDDDEATPPRFVTDTGCAICHLTEAFVPATRTAEDHGSFATELQGEHARSDCSACHRRSGSPPPIASCAACHPTPHREPLATGRPCDTCHDPAGASFAAAGEDMDPARHDALPLAPPHDLACTACHEAGAAFPERFPGRAADDCAACHGDPHRGAFAAGAFAADPCTSCHVPRHFTPSTFVAASHTKTRFALDGAHLAVPCGRCHEGAGAERTFRGTERTCASCHADPHGGTFDLPGRPRAVAGRVGCARCHATTSFREVRSENFDHVMWTGRALTASHAEASCIRCHGRDANGSLGGAPMRCAGCHEDVHRGQLARSGVTDCSRCHVETHSFGDLEFDHTRDTQFPLDADHGLLPCQSCHRSERAGDGTLVTHYRPLGARCRDCHRPRVRSEGENR